MDEATRLMITSDDGKQAGVDARAEEKPPKYTSAYLAVHDLLRELVKREFNHLRDCKITLLFRNGGWESKGKTVYGQVRKVSELDNAIMVSEAGIDEVDILMTLNGDEWKRLTPIQREAVIFHELCHIEPGDGGWTILPHEVEGFAKEVKHYGTWTLPLRQMSDAVKAYEQARLPGVTS